MFSHVVRQGLMKLAAGEVNPFLTGPQRAEMRASMSALPADKARVMQDILNHRAAMAAAVPGSPEFASLQARMREAQGNLQQLHRQHSFMHNELIKDPYAEFMASRGETPIFRGKEAPLRPGEKTLFGVHGYKGRLKGLEVPGLADEAAVARAMEGFPGAAAATAKPGLFGRMRAGMSGLAPRMKQLGALGAVGALGYGLYKATQPSEPKALRPLPDLYGNFGV